MLCNRFEKNKVIDFEEIIYPIVKMTLIETILSLVAVEYFHLEQLDVKTNFLHGYIWRKCLQIQLTDSECNAFH